MIHGILTIAFILLLLLVGMPVVTVMATKRENRYKELFAHRLFFPSCLVGVASLWWAGQVVSPAFFVLLVVPGSALFIYGVLFRAGKL